MFWDALYAAGAIVVSSFCGGAVVLALSSWLGKVWAGRILEKDKANYQQQIEKIRSDYRQEVEEKLQRLRDQIERGQFIHRLQFETEFNMYLALWKPLARVRSLVLSLRPSFDWLAEGKSRDAVLEERLSSLSEVYREFQDSYRDSEPFLPPEIYEAAKELAWIMIGEARQAADHRTPDGDVRQDYWDEREENVKKISEQADAICSAIRKRIGIIGALPEEPG